MEVEHRGDCRRNQHVLLHPEHHPGRFQILLDGKEVSNYLYTQREAEALLRGGVHRVWLDNLRAGKHEMTAIFTGKGPHERDYQRGATLEIDKGVGAKYVELKISDRARQLQPEFIVKEWE